jgi:hypothetical protein
MMNISNEDERFIAKEKARNTSSTSPDKISEETVDEDQVSAAREGRRRSSLGQFLEESSESLVQSALDAWEEGRREKWMVHPTSRLRLAWLLGIALLLFYVMFITPYRIGFDIEARDAFAHWELAIDFMFIFDVLVNFRIGILDSDGKICMVPRVVAFNYLKTWFAIDLVSSVPFQLLPLSKSFSNTRLLKIIKLTRLGKLTKVLKMNTLLESAEDVFTSYRHHMKLLKLLGLSVVVTHLNACVWAYLGNSNSVFIDNHHQCVSDFDFGGHEDGLPWFCSYAHLNWDRNTHSKRCAWFGR